MSRLLQNTIYLAIILIVVILFSLLSKSIPKNAHGVYLPIKTSNFNPISKSMVSVSTDRSDSNEDPMGSIRTSYSYTKNSEFTNACNKSRDYGIKIAASKGMNLIIGRCNQPAPQASQHASADFIAYAYHTKKDN